MVSRSYSNLLDLAGGELPSPPAFSRMTVQFPRIMTVSGIVSDTDDDPSGSVSSGLSSPSIPHDRLIIVANQLPIRAHQKTFSDGSNRWDFSLDENSLLLQLKDGLGPGPGIGPKNGSGPGPKTGSNGPGITNGPGNGPGITNGPGNGPGPDGMEVIYVGCLKEEIHPSEQDEVSQILLEKFKCVPTFFPPGLYTRFYHGFCKQQLWPLFHYMLPLSPDLGVGLTGRYGKLMFRSTRFSLIESWR
ncbi:putative alpha,alpha-trehalose-phosphate synthase (UDP-forming) [Helianthus annuus]|nr:putative alpha,alpha-trehalose-phosphate synthase (UDP-forming) [Helianthus annuus]